MAKKAATTDKRSVLFRVDDETWARLEHTAKLETGSDSIPAWALSLCLERADMVEKAIREGEVVWYRGKLLLKSELSEGE